MKRTFLSIKTLCAILILATSANLWAVELVTNGGFESGNFSGWTLNDPSNFSGVDNDPTTGPLFAHSGNAYAFLGPQSTNDPSFFGSLSQTLNTVAGGTYTLSFFLANDVDAPINSFSILFGGSPVYSTTASVFGTSGNYIQITIGGLIATGSTTVLEFRARHDQDFWRLDDVSVQAVPEPATTLLFVVPAFAALLFRHHFRGRVPVRATVRR